MIIIERASIRYGRRAVVDDVSTSIKAGKLTTLIGANGAGKSTLLSLVGRLIDGEGRYIIEGKSISDYRKGELAKSLSMLRQNNHITIRISVRELVSFGRFPYSKSKLTDRDHQIVEKALKAMDLTTLADSYLDQLSGGERQRAFIAMTVAQDTKYLLLDEPLNNLDMVHSVEIMRLLRSLVDEQGKSVVLVLHDINFASSYSDEIIALKGGKLLYHGPPQEVITTEALWEIYGMHIPVIEQEGKRYCLFY
jgi:iron complex transport system ATP-binding protein